MNPFDELESNVRYYCRRWPAVFSTAHNSTITAEDGTEYERLLDKVDKRVRTQQGGKRGKAAWSRLEEILADRKLEKDLRDTFDDES